MSRGRSVNFKNLTKEKPLTDMNLGSVVHKP